MTEVVEGVAIGMVNEDETKCPFDHETPTPPKVDNDLIGVGGTLARKMKNGSSTHLYSKLRKDQSPVLNPRNIPGHALYKKGSRKPRPVLLNIRKDTTSKLYQHAYPVTCAAHHCIPAQESLKRSQLLEFMVKKGDSEDLKDDSFSNGVVWADVGYDVNGVENGVFLPGNYAVGGGRGGMGVWEGDDSNEDDDVEYPDDVSDDVDLNEGAVDAMDGLADGGPIIDSAPSSNRLNGTNFQADPNNRKWRYVSLAMKLTRAQFHDRHEYYSDYVLAHLEKIYANYLLLKEKQVDEKNCPDCKEKAKKIKDLGVPTPFGLVARLNGLSASLRGYLSGGRWSDKLYTSNWVLAHVRNRQGSGG